MHSIAYLDRIRLKLPNHADVHILVVACVRGLGKVPLYVCVGIESLVDARVRWLGSTILAQTIFMCCPLPRPWTQTTPLPATEAVKRGSRRQKEQVRHCTGTAWRCSPCTGSECTARSPSPRKCRCERRRALGKREQWGAGGGRGCDIGERMCKPRSRDTDRCTRKHNGSYTTSARF